MCSLLESLITERTGIPLQITVDKGSETGWQCAIQYALRSVTD